LLPEAVVAKREPFVDGFSCRRQGRRVDLTAKQLMVGHADPGVDRYAILLKSPAF
jgi:hypothetical protein